ncbi:MAG: ribosome biogenesis GTP-binding protein YihA/YsxC [Clostridiales Family XIII bacterium]|nr:ribosome biogenesis GTP-binding protein YihA/YsxC [Clostridiales Family XIII bacterium]
MKIDKSELLAIAVAEKQYPFMGPVEIAFAGRSNVGKSSLLNLIAGRKKLAFVSGNPGKTQTINFYSINDDKFRIVDLPGYGYAKVSRSVSSKWGDMIEAYLENRESLKKVALLVDIRHEPTAMDVQLYEYLQHYGLSGLIVLTKADKVSRNALQKQIKMIKTALGADKEDKAICVSALKKTGVDELLGEIFRIVSE